MLKGHPQSFYCAITSTYRPFFLPRPVLPLRADGAPSKSSIELAWLNEVEGLGGPAELPGRDEAPPAGGTAPVETDRAGPNAGVCGRPSEDDAGLLDSGGGGAPADEPGRLPDAAGTAGGGMLLPLALLLGGAEAFGGGGVARAGVALLGSFPLTHFLSSSSK